MPLDAGAKLGPYAIEAAIGSGGMGEVYRAKDINLKRFVAIKVLPVAFAADPERLARFFTAGRPTRRCFSWEREFERLGATNAHHRRPETAGATDDVGALPTF